MRTFELRVYALRTKAALDFYAGTVYPRHLHNFGLFGVEAHGLWTAKADEAHRAFVLVSYAEGDDLARSRNATYKAQRRPTTPETLISPRSWALNQRSWFRQQVLRSNEEKGE